VEILNAGQQIASLSRQVDVDGETIVPLDLGHLPAGVYTVRLWDGQSQEQLLLIKN
jgi:hypothetical protein